MGYVWRKANSKVKITMKNFEELKVNFLRDIKATALILNRAKVRPGLIMDNGKEGVN